MQAILDFLKSVVDTVTFLIDFVIGMIKDIVYLIQLTAKFLANIPSYFSWLPGSFATMIVLLFGIVVVYKVLGREG